MCLGHCWAGVCSQGAGDCSLCVPVLQERGECRWGCQVCLAGQPGGRGELRSALPASRDASRNNRKYLQRHYGPWEIQSWKTQSVLQTGHLPRRQTSLVLPLVNQEFTKLNWGAVSVCCSPSAVCRIPMLAYTYRYIIESCRIYTAMIYASILPFKYVFYILRHIMNANQLFGSTIKILPEPTCKPQEGVPRYKISEI